MAMIGGEPLKVGFTGPVYMGFTELAHFSHSLLTLLIFFRAIAADEEVFRAG
jgi:hypothetical protein